LYLPAARHPEAQKPGGQNGRSIDAHGTEDPNKKNEEDTVRGRIVRDEDLRASYGSEGYLTTATNHDEHNRK